MNNTGAAQRRAASWSQSAVGLALEEKGHNHMKKKSSPLTKKQNTVPFESDPKPRLIAADPVDNGNGTSSVVMRWNASFAAEFQKMTGKKATPKNISAWIDDTLYTDPLRLKKYLLIPES